MILLTMAVILANPGGPRTVRVEVDGTLPEPSSHLGRDYKVEELYRASLHDQGLSPKTHVLVNSSFPGTEVSVRAESPMFSMFTRAYAEHRPLILSPDDIWLLISQSFAWHVNRNPEAIRSKIVKHDGKMLLSVESSADVLSPEADWASILDGFAKQIDRNTVSAVADMMSCNFSTTDPVGKTVSQMTLMNATQAYFDYEVMYISCGIPYVELQGTVKDWKLVLKKARQLRKYGLGWWVDRLTPVLEQFVKASRGKAETEFWQNMVCTVKPDAVRGVGCLPGQKPTEFDGWFLCFFPFDKDGRTPDKVTSIHRMIPETVRVEFKYKVTDELGNILSDTPMEMMAGFMGYAEDDESYALKPVRGWIIGKYSELQKMGRFGE